ncbi:MAG: hypothetical protein A2087_13290 [Spirochaetes bacterium GWD1_61_31]|nr:MAG: hypothetical protein A2Y37_02695 [Spirochaetes bacterium GWB1_60_80]OHD31283.1 MAG: hypothetical protein A2004_13570 [Spirochaetes bacterium GWC1_61_12]OHD39467.1 MAG: hypothetical protein A2087_13290 [Spirochaetes bacterium GWD1_61_31]OHD45519.1 MAG: hypothetical protein A2Y35_02965 [Spirochaetes bacterium GWE1_60_18]OHD58092.1 MAG: hypothetical protein A2Y32_05540 [Spirochaetes bacterium GWF1_60_12]
MNHATIDTPANFAFASRADEDKAGDAGLRTLQIGRAKLSLHLSAAGDNVFRVQLTGKRWPDGNPSCAQLTSAEFAGRPSSATCRIAPDASLNLELAGHTILEGSSGQTFGLNGAKWLLSLTYDPACRYFGLGGKNLGFELSEQRGLFWNTDGQADASAFTSRQALATAQDSSFPVLIIRKPLPQAPAAASNKQQAAPARAVWIGLVINSSYPSFINTGAGDNRFGPASTPFERRLYVGAVDGEPDVYLVADETAAGLIRKLQALQGRMERPPLWALGHHQSRSASRSYDDLDRLAREFESRGIPNDGLWLDIDYMEDFRVFTINKKYFWNPPEQVEELRKRGFQVVPVLQPGLRRDPTYIEYQEAVAKNLLCKTPEGQPFVGFACPGYAVFPDFALSAARRFWTDRVTQFARLGFAGFWLDANAPASGSVPLEDMLFNQGKLNHGSWHNQYALALAEATRQGLLNAHPDRRPFVLSRSAFLSMSRQAATWNGQPLATDSQLAGSIASALNLSVSGMPFNGPAILGGASAGDSSDGDRLRRWYQATFLFPLLRNHSQSSSSGAMGANDSVASTDADPWNRDRKTIAAITAFIRSRYKLMPYLYNVFLEQETAGDPILRPLWYHCDEDWTLAAADSYTLGRDLLHAPLLSGKHTSHRVQLPAGRWFSFCDGRWLSGGSHLVKPGTSTPLFGRVGSVLPLRAGLPTDSRTDLRTIDLLILAEATGRDAAALTFTASYLADDGHSFAYRSGAQSGLCLSLSIERDTIRLETRQEETGYGLIQFRLLLPVASAVRKLYLNGEKQPLKREILPLVGRKLAVYASPTSPASLSY